MAAKYLTSKGLDVRGHVHKNDGERALTPAQIQSILNAVKETAQTFNKNWQRDYAAIYLGYSLGLLIGEACILERKHFNRIEDEHANIPTLLQGTIKKKSKVVLQKSPPIIERQVIDFIEEYIQNAMRPDQQWLFESSPGRHISVSYLSRIFNTYVVTAGLSPKFSWQALRHGRGFRLWALTNNPAAVRDGLRLGSLKGAERYAILTEDQREDYSAKLNAQAPRRVKGMR